MQKRLSLRSEGGEPGLRGDPDLPRRRVHVHLAGRRRGKLLFPEAAVGKELQEAVAFPGQGPGPAAVPGDRVDVEDPVQVPPLAEPLAAAAEVHHPGRGPVGDPEAPPGSRGQPQGVGEGGVHLDEGQGVAPGVQGKAVHPEPPGRGRPADPVVRVDRHGLDSLENGVHGIHPAVAGDAVQADGTVAHPAVAGLAVDGDGRKGREVPPGEEALAAVGREPPDQPAAAVGDPGALRTRRGQVLPGDGELRLSDHVESEAVAVDAAVDHLLVDEAGIRGGQVPRQGAVAALPVEANPPQVLEAGEVPAQIDPPVAGQRAQGFGQVEGLRGAGVERVAARAVGAGHHQRRQAKGRREAETWRRHLSPRRRPGRR